MSSVNTCRAVGLKNGAKPCPQLKRKYRRSTTTKAPRKRTFVANMVKYSEQGFLGINAAQGVTPEPCCALVADSASACCQAPGNAPLATGKTALPLLAGVGGNGNNNISNGDSFGFEGGENVPSGLFMNALKALLLVVATCAGVMVSNPAPSFANTVMPIGETQRELSFGQVILSQDEKRMLQTAQYRTKHRDWTSFLVGEVAVKLNKEDSQL